MTDDATTARRKAMADELQAMAAAMKKQNEAELRRLSWNPDEYWLTMARVSKEAQLNIGNTGPRVYIVGGVVVTDGTVAAEAQRKEAP